MRGLSRLQIPGTASREKKMKVYRLKPGDDDRPHIASGANLKKTPALSMPRLRAFVVTFAAIVVQPFAVISYGQVQTLSGSPVVVIIPGHLYSTWYLHRHCRMICCHAGFEALNYFKKARGKISCVIMRNGCGSNKSRQIFLIFTRVQ